MIESDTSSSENNLNDDKSNSSQVSVDSIGIIPEKKKRKIERLFMNSSNHKFLGIKLKKKNNNVKELIPREEVNWMLLYDKVIKNIVPPFQKKDFNLSGINLDEIYSKIAVDIYDHKVDERAKNLKKEKESFLNKIFLLFQDNVKEEKKQIFKKNLSSMIPESSKK